LYTPFTPNDVRGKNNSTQVNVLLDEGAQRSFVTQDLASYLHLQSERRASTQTLPVTTIRLVSTDGTEIPAYWSIVQVTVIQGPGPIAVQSKLGYLFSGPLYNYSIPMMSGIFHLSSVSLYERTPGEHVWETNFTQNEQSTTFFARIPS